MNRRLLSKAGFPFHYETTATLNTSIDAAFAHLDDFHKLSAHMEKSSGMMMGSRMTIDMDEREGRAIGSQVSMGGRMLGMRLSLREVVTERTPPTRKVWRTVDTDLMVIGSYELGFELRENGPATALRVFIDYDLPGKGVGRWLGHLFGRMYARWCTEKMATERRTLSLLIDARASRRPAARAIRFEITRRGKKTSCKTSCGRRVSRPSTGIAMRVQLHERAAWDVPLRPIRRTISA